MERVVILPEVFEQLEELIKALYEKEYFSYREDAIGYALAIYAFMETIPDQKAKPTLQPDHGAWYCQYKYNRQTTWFITFDTDGETWVVRHVLNNHTRDYPDYIMS